jgi:GT2 family glycosyltransferase
MEPCGGLEFVKEMVNPLQIKKTDRTKVAVVILTCSQKEVTLRCLSSFRLVKSPAHNIVLWDNGSTDGTAEAVKQLFPEVLVHYHSKNLGAYGGRNAAAELAIKMFDPSYLLFIDNDTVVTPGFLDALLEPFETDRRVGQTVPKIRQMRDSTRLDQAGCRVRFCLGNTENVGSGEIDRSQYDERRRCIAGGIFVVPTELFREVDGFDLLFDPYSAGDLDFSLRLHKAGYHSLYIPEALIFHDRSQTFERGKYTERYARQKARNWFILMSRHATVLEKIGFALIGAPRAVVRVLFREGQIGNIAGLQGIICGGLRSLLQRSHS